MDDEAKSVLVPSNEYEEWEELQKPKTPTQKYYENIAEDMLEVDPMDLANWIEQLSNSRNHRYKEYKNDKALEELNDDFN